MLEETLWQQGYRFVGGVDEAGRGPLAGPLVASCVILLPQMTLSGLADSKKLSPARREHLFEAIVHSAFSIGISIVSEKMIDCVGIQTANIYAFREAVAHASRSHAPDYLILDWLTLPGIHLPSISTSHAESKSWSVAAASIVAKVFRDRLMRDDYDPFFPEYGLASHKGYGTLAHRENMKQYGLAPCHRRSFCRAFTKRTGE